MCLFVQIVPCSCVTWYTQPPTLYPGFDYKFLLPFCFYPNTLLHHVLFNEWPKERKNERKEAVKPMDCDNSESGGSANGDGDSNTQKYPHEYILFIECYIGTCKIDYLRIRADYFFCLALFPLPSFSFSYTSFVDKYIASSIQVHLVNFMALRLLRRPQKWKSKAHCKRKQKQTQQLLALRSQSEW